MKFFGKGLAGDTPWQAYQFSYQYDPTGNPSQQDKNGLVFSNSFNHLNQNVATVPGGSLAVLGRVNYAGGTVAVNSVQAQLSPDLIFAATGIAFTMGTNALDTVFTDPFGRYTNRETLVVVSQKSYGYDSNGNLTNDGRMAYFWNDENRLVAVRDAKTGALIQENRYDGLGRRRERILFPVAGGDDPGSTNRYLYQDWLVLAVTDGTGNVLETYTHGADLSGQVGGGAGGIGGILASTQANGPAYYHYDFNVSVVNVSSSNQTQLAKYTYGPFGEVLLKDGAFTSRYQFSSKEYDASTGLNYYGYRFYSPELGRWLNRDPIGKRGGINVFTFCMNGPISSYDYLGLCRIEYLCTLNSEEGQCHKTCTYSCVETGRSQPGYGPGVPCYEVPEPFTFADEKKASGIIVFGICCKEGKCKKDYTGIGTVGGNDLDCSKSACRNSCKTVMNNAKKLCKFHVNPPACIAAAEAAKAMCMLACEFCNKP